MTRRCGRRIIDLNLGATTPDGSAWSGGVFPAGMTILVPAGLSEHQSVSWTDYEVTEGDSVYRIATRLADGDNRRVRDLADAIIERNLGRIMVDGAVFDDPSLVRIGWHLDVPVDVPSGRSTATHLVVPASRTGASPKTSSPRSTTIRRLARSPR